MVFVTLSMQDKQQFYWYFHTFIIKSMWSNCFCCYGVKYSRIHWQKPGWIIVIYYIV